MAKLIGPKCKLCRRAQTKLLLKGDRCFTSKCAIVKRNYPPGVAGAKGKQRLTSYGLQLYEKQKAKRMYGVLEKQFSNYFAKAVKKIGNTGEIMYQLLELRLDNVVYRLGLADSRSQARQFIGHGFFTINGKKVDIASYQVKVGDIISFSKRALNFKKIQDILVAIEKKTLPTWVFWEQSKNEGKVVSRPTLEELGKDFDMKLIIEYYSR